MEFTVGDLVTECLTEQVGVVIQTGPTAVYKVFWLLQGLSMWNEYGEWKDARAWEGFA